MSNIINTTDIQFVSDANRIDSRIVAKALDVQHKNFLALIDKYKISIEEYFGVIVFETRTFETAGGMQKTRIALLTKDQIIFLITMSRNTPRNVELKMRMVKEMKRSPRFDFQATCGILRNV